MDKKLYKSANDKVLAGVCGGIGEYFDIDPVVIRILWVIFTLLGGAGLIAYIIAAIIMPANPLGGSREDNYTDAEDYGSGSRRRNSSRGTSLVLGAILVLFGAFMLVRDFIPWIPRDIILAVILIGLGVFFLVRKN
jgi:phage shock protein C